jgi:hypothetical protein
MNDPVCRMGEIRFDFGREARTGLPEAMLCTGKTAEQITALLEQARSREHPVLFTRMSPAQRAQVAFELDYDPLSRTAWFGRGPRADGPARIAIVTAGTSDLAVAREAARTLRFFGLASDEIADVGVAGLWRLMDQVETLRCYALIIAVAGMEGALFSVLGGLVPGVVIAVPTSIGYGVARAGETALFSALCGCAQGMLVVNIDNGFGAACAARRILLNADRLAPASATMQANG